VWIASAGGGLFYHPVRMGKRAYKPDDLRRRPFRGSVAVREGLLTVDQLHGRAWRMLFRDVYVDAGQPVTYLLRCRAAGLILPAGGALTGRSAARLSGLPLGDPTDPIEVVVPPDVRFRSRECRVRRAWLPAGHILPREPREPREPRVTVPQRTAWEIASEPDLTEAVVALDVLFHYKYLRPAAMESWIAVHPWSRAAKAFSLADGRAESPQETRARLRILAAGFPAPVPQHEVWVKSSLLARLDLAWPAAKVAVEYDGEWHSDERQLAHDRYRLNKLVNAGWVVLHLTKGDLTDPVLFAVFAEQLRAALARPATI
jgi:hypothetical protein